ncbi:hypothetical protein EL09_22825 [Salmonella enterica subsp. enterica]|nr:hypothetical protein [Salmonella enterica subsp. enterica]MIF52502.1 hypothetical protein [Salmonella enterica subsp. enterica]
MVRIHRGARSSSLKNHTSSASNPVIDTGASCDAPARPTIEMWLSARHKKSADALCVIDEVSGRQSRYLNEQVR